MFFVHVSRPRVLAPSRYPIASSSRRPTRARDATTTTPTMPTMTMPTMTTTTTTRAMGTRGGRRAMGRSARPSVPGRPFPTTTTRASASASAETPPALPFRVGHGFDLHRLESVDEFPDLKLIIGGIEIPHDRGCVAHSDGDVLMHCVVDAITGALGLPDIGQLFPDTDPKWKGQTSDAFVREAVRLMELEGYAIGNLDCTLIAQRPKISPHKDSIRANVAKVLGVHESVVNVKAKTHEKVDSLGENRSIACHTVIMLIRA